MQANELKLGNYVLIDDKIGTIDSIGIFGVNNHRDNYEEEWIEFERVQPIPLTEEWLLKFGFEKEEITTKVNGGTETMLCKEFIMMQRHHQEMWCAAPYGYLISPNMTIYVHQLQNLYFALTGEELEFKK